VTLPTGWARGVVFSDVLDYQGGSQPPKAEFTSEPGAGRIRLLQIRDFASDAKAVYIKDNGKWPRCGSNDIMIGRYGASVGKILTGKAGAYNVALVKLLFDRAGIEPKFLFHWLHLDVFQGKLASVSRSAQDGFNKEDLADIPFPLPPLAEQRRIVAKLDTLTARLRRARTELDRVAAMAKAMRRAAMATAFDGIASTSALGEFTKDVRYGTAQKCDYRDEGIAVLRIPNVQSTGIVLHDIKRASFSAKEVETLALQLGDVLVIRSNGSLDLVGRCAVVGTDSVGLLYAGYLIRLRLDQARMHAEFLRYALLSPKSRQAIENAARSTSGVNNINAQQLRALTVPAPVLDEQIRLTELLKTAFARADRLEAEAARARALLDRLEAAILARAFRGELVPQDPTDEPATALLNRIREARAAAPKPKRGRRAMAEADSNVYRE
jgi:type I restriction enzyme, S subunit